jgi:hypothetical protein
MQQAVVADPDLISASDGVFRLNSTAGGHDLGLVLVELERIMARHPNRGSVMRAMLFVSPQWGGTPDQVSLLCDRYAPMVKSVPGYTSQICTIDAAYFAHFARGPQRDAARQALAATDNPILDYARLEDATTLPNPTEADKKVLLAAAAHRPLTVAESQALDGVKGPYEGLNQSPEFLKALPDATLRDRAKAEHDPYNSDVVITYLEDLRYLHEALGQPYQGEDALKVLKSLMHGAPYNASGWMALATAAGDSRTFPEVDLDRVAEAQVYYKNAIVYSDYSQAALSGAIDSKMFMVIDLDKSPIFDGNDEVAAALPAPGTAERTRLDALVNCPLVREMRLLNAECASRGMPSAQCTGLLRAPGPMIARMRQLQDSNSCAAEFSLPIIQLLVIPEHVKF